MKKKFFTLLITLISITSLCSCMPDFEQYMKNREETSAPISTPKPTPTNPTIEIPPTTPNGNGSSGGNAGIVGSNDLKKSKFYIKALPGPSKPGTIVSLTIGGESFVDMAIYVDGAMDSPTLGTITTDAAGDATWSWSVPDLEPNTYVIKISDGQTTLQTNYQIIS